jgi:hypothetical protein
LGPPAALTPAPGSITCTRCRSYVGRRNREFEIAEESLELQDH